MPPQPAPKPEEYAKFEDFMRRLVKVPKQDIDKAVKEFDSGRKRTKKKGKKK
jgi:hypothetical protein